MVLPAGVAIGVFLPTVFSFAATVAIAAINSPIADILHPGEKFLSSRGEWGWKTLGLSLYASFMANWVLYLPAIIGAENSWPGVIGYTISSGVPYILLMLISTRVRGLVKNGFCGVDHIFSRFGRIAHVILAFISFSMMFITLCAELTSVSMSMNALTGGNFPVALAVIVTALVPIFYLIISGMKCCLVSDVVQAVVIVLLFMPFCIYLIVNYRSPEWVEWSSFKNYDDIISGSVLVLSIWPIFLTDQGVWQRVWAARSDWDVHASLLTCGVLASCSTFVFACTGLFCIGPIRVESNENMFTFVAQNLSPFMNILLCVLALTCVISSVDTYQAGIVSLIGSDLLRMNKSFNWARLALFLINVPAIIIALLNLPLITLLMITNFLCACIAGPFLLSIRPRTTTIGFFWGVFISFLTFFFCAIFDAWHKEYDKFIDWNFFVPRSISSLSYVITFLTIPFVGGMTTFIASEICIFLGYFEGALLESSATDRDQISNKNIKDIDDPDGRQITISGSKVHFLDGKVIPCEEGQVPCNEGQVSTCEGKAASFQDQVPICVDQVLTFMDNVPIFVDQVHTCVDQASTCMDQVPTCVDEAPSVVTNIPSAWTIGLSDLPTVQQKSTLDKAFTAAHRSLRASVMEVGGIMINHSNPVDVVYIPLPNFPPSPSQSTQPKDMEIKCNAEKDLDDATKGNEQNDLHAIEMRTLSEEDNHER